MSCRASARARARRAPRRARARRGPTARRRASRRGSIAPRGARAAGALARRARGRACARGAHGSSGGAPSETIARAAVTARALARRAAAARRRTLARERTREDGARRAPRAPRTSSQRAAVALGCRQREHAELRQLAPERAREAARGGLQRRVAAALARRSCADRVVDRLLRVVEARGRGSRLPAPARAGRPRAGARRRRPARGAAPASRMLQTCRSCSRVKPIAPVSWCVSRKTRLRGVGGVRGGGRGRLVRRALRGGLVGEPAAALDQHRALRRAGAARPGTSRSRGRTGAGASRSRRSSSSAAAIVPSSSAASARRHQLRSRAPEPGPSDSPRAARRRARGPSAA